MTAFHSKYLQQSESAGGKSNCKDQLIEDYSKVMNISRNISSKIVQNFLECHLQNATASAAANSKSFLTIHNPQHQIAESGGNNNFQAIFDWTIKTLLKLPYGQSCKEAILWNSRKLMLQTFCVQKQRENVDSPDHATNTFTLIDFLVQHKQLLDNRHFYICFEENDAIALPNAITKVNLKSEFATKNYTGIASSVLQALELIGSTNSNQEEAFQQELMSILTYHKAMNGIDVVLSDLMATAVALPYQIRQMEIFKYCFDAALAVFTDSSTRDLQSKFITCALKNSSLVSKQVSRFRNLLFSVGLHFSKEFDLFYKKCVLSSDWVAMIDPIIGDASQCGNIANLARSEDRESDVTETFSNLSLTQSEVRPIDGNNSNLPAMSTNQAVTAAVAASFINEEGSRVVHRGQEYSSPQEFIHFILQKDFKYSTSLEPPPLESRDENLKESLQLLAKKLYTSDVHFVMELLQNADDNSYLASDTNTNSQEKIIKFQITENTLFVYNNERGFSADNIYGVCRVGGSTKKAMKGYIGQKGIG